MDTRQSVASIVTAASNVANGKSVLADCTSEVTCSSCKDRFNQISKIPRLLPCFHTVCESCLYREKGSQCCPMCKERFNLGDEGITGLKVNYYVNKMVQIFNLLESEQTERLKCMGCDKSAHFRCMKCSENYCHAHSAFHQKSRATYDHQVIAVKDVANNISTLSSLREQEYCITHTTRSLELYCLECDKALCSLCCITKHRTHATCSLHSAGKRAKLELAELGPKAEEKLGTERQKVGKLKQLASHVARDHETSKRGLREFTERMIQNLMAREEELLAQMTSRKHNLTKLINNKVHVLEDRLKMVHQTKTFAEKIQKNWSEVEILNVRKEIVERLGEFSDPDTPDGVCLDTLYTTPIQFAPSGEDGLIQGIWSFRNRYMYKTSKT